MFKKDVITYFGSQIAVADALGIGKSSVSLWGRVIPQLRAMQLEQLTGGKLHYDEFVYSSKPVKRSLTNVQ
ncbi:Cro/CI family transcriptional regulator [Suttonella ornithocola]|uniref:DNA-binding transcriptional regulator DicC n=1 Tax=Suttonella ornithocola TaxID=279832 RepID=A0A380RCM7_9GAMM|nr:Cro/CI family transcriptional regulator [Suttonella ornithocola]SUO95210.1 DNA-binding transcriptional regulator DicC [Suttonella ornithocola]SUQ09769.1 DNA-binding transcriptional regulator DicC [Suttonella ornithocola]